LVWTGKSAAGGRTTDVSAADNRGAANAPNNNPKAAKAADTRRRAVRVGWFMSPD
jgi:hypothetical protein